ncbi:MAG: hypothetical protein AAGB05_09945 [Pseudomonadota bacterium]
MTYRRAMVRLVIPLALALLVTVSSVGWGVALGRVPPAGSVTLCTGHGVVTIFVDADGMPVERVVLCPDCAIAAPVPGPLAIPARATRLSRDTQGQARAQPVRPAAPWSRTTARGPPVFA